MTSESAHSQPKSKGPGFDRTQWFVASLLFAMLFLNYVDRLVLSVLAPIMRDEIGLSQTDYAWAVNAFLLSYAVMYFGSGVILDRIGSRKGLTLFVALWSVASALHASVRGFLDLAFFRFLLGVTEPGGWTGAVKTVSERFNAAQRAIATGIFSTGASIATMVSPPLVVYLRNRWGWRLAFLVPSCAGFLWLPFWLKVTRRPALNPASEDRGAGFSRAQLKLLGNRRVLAYVLARFFGPAQVTRHPGYDDNGHDALGIDCYARELRKSFGEPSSPSGGRLSNAAESLPDRGGRRRPESLVDGSLPPAACARWGRARSRQQSRQRQHLPGRPTPSRSRSSPSQIPRTA